MAQHITQSARFRDFSVKDISSEEEAFLTFAEMRFGDKKCFACPKCEVVGQHYLRKNRKQWRCRYCHSYFSPTSGTALNNRKLSYATILHVVLKYVRAPQGVAASAVATELGVDPRSIWLLLSKLRELLVLKWDIRPLSGTVQVDGGHFCGKPRKANRRKPTDSKAANAILRNRKAAIDPTVRRMEPWNAEKFKNRRIVLAIREISTEEGKGATRTIVAVLRKEDANSAVPIIKKCVEKGSVIMSDAGGAFRPLIYEFDHKAVNHSEEYCDIDGVNNNQAESYMSRLRRAEYGVFRGMRPTYFLDYCVEMAWRENYRHHTIKERMKDLFQRIGKSTMSISFCRYHQGNRRDGEWSDCFDPLSKLKK